MAPTLSSIKNRPVAVLGGGVLGRRIGCTWAAGGWDVRIRDPSAEQRNAAIHYIETNVASYAITTGAKPGKAEAFEDLAEAVKDAWTVIEAVPENLGLKISTFADLERLAPSDAILVSNSSSYKSSEMLEKVGKDARKRIMNTHYMMPPDNRIVELMTDGETDEDLFPFYVERLKEVGMHPLVARKESTGFVFNRVWAAIKREFMMILAEGVSTPEELDAVWIEMFSGGKVGPCAMMDNVGLDTVQFIEQHYIKERGLPTEHTVDWLKKNYIDQGKLGAKSGKGGLYPPGHTIKTTGEEKNHHENLNAPTLYLLDVGLNTLADPLHSGRVMVGAPDGRALRSLVSGQMLPDGLDISLKTGRMYWTNMGIPKANDGTVQSCRLDGSDVQTVVPVGAVHTPKQLIIDHTNDKLYFCDREGLRVMRCNFDGSEHETIVRTGDWEVEEQAADQLNWCVGISVNQKEGKFYWTQKGLSKGGKGRIFRANTTMPPGEKAENRSDIEMLLSGLPEPIDLEVDQDTQTLYWTDRGDPPMGNTLNSVKIADLKPLKAGEKNPKLNLLARQLHEAIGLKLDQLNKHIYLTDLSGTVYRCGMDGKDKKKIYDGEYSFTGIALTHV